VGVATGAGALFLEGGHYPDGLDCECFTFEALKTAWKEATLTSDREHVTPFIWRSPDRFRVGSLRAMDDYGRYRWVVDNEADFELVRQVYEALYPFNQFFLMQDILEFLARNPNVSNLNQSYVGHENYEAVWFPASNKSTLDEGSAE
jgi:spore coat polysaccharide biosynthesis protein SpsF